MNTASRRRAYTGHPLFSIGLRPFFLAAAAWPAATVPIWVLAWLGVAPFAGAMTRDWHVHEMLFGYLAAVVAGFLLTAVPNWTGRMPVIGRPLAGLAGLWLAGRLAMLAAPTATWAGVTDSLFLVVFAAVIWREVLAGRNWRNLPVGGLVTLLALANIGLHLRGQAPELALASERVALGAAAVLIALIGGRVTPSFTRNWLIKRGATALPATASRFDTAVIVATALGAAAWALAPESRTAGVLLAVAGAANLARLTRWRGLATRAEPLVWILHVGYAWLGVGLIALGAAALAPAHIARSAGVHALTVGAIGVMTLAMMTRATRGHTGRSLETGPYTLALYALANLAAILRVLAALAPEQQAMLLGLASLAWSGAFALFLLVYGPMLTGPRATPAGSPPATAIRGRAA
ncbi:MAG: NnrS family protein [Proteobacteria bacterium]|nr:NnrS family protein [Pseudomonadota bacterium]